MDADVRVTLSMSQLNELPPHSTVASRTNLFLWREDTVHRLLELRGSGRWATLALTEPQNTFHTETT